MKLTYLVAISLWRRNGSKLIDNSSITRFTLLKLSFALSNLRRVSSLRFLYFKTPAASSIIARFSSGLPLIISPILPWDIIDKEFTEEPESINKLVISFNLTLLLFIKYSFSPDE